MSRDISVYGQIFVSPLAAGLMAPLCVVKLNLQLGDIFLVIGHGCEQTLDEEES